MKTVFILLLLLLGNTTVSCQNKEKPQLTHKKEDSMLIDLDSLRDSFSEHRVYYARYSNIDCLFDLRINDVYTEWIRSPRDGGGALTINTEILHSGKNTVTLKLYPLPGKDLITNTWPFELKICYKDFKKPVGERDWVCVLEMPYLDLSGDAAVPYYEYTAEFDAEVPYQITGWSDCIDLRKIPDIEERVVKKFNELREMLVKQDADSFLEALKYKNYDIAIPLYQSIQEFTDMRNDDRKDIMRKNPKNWQKIEDYELVFYADGRLVTLESRKRRGYASALINIEPTEGDGANIFYFEMRLGIREGTDELIPIR